MPGSPFLLAKNFNSIIASICYHAIAGAGWCSGAFPFPNGLTPMDDVFSKLMLAYILFAVGFVICVIAFFVSGHNAWVDSTASRQYRQDCSSAVSVKGNPQDFGDCYVGQARIEITRHENTITHQHSYLSKWEPPYTYSANFTLPGGSQASSAISPAYGQSHISYSGNSQVEVWKKAVTQVTINGDTELTAANPTLEFHKDLKNAGLSILGVLVFGGLALFFNRRDSALRYS